MKKLIFILLSIFSATNLLSAQTITTKPGNSSVKAAPSASKTIPATDLVTSLSTKEFALAKSFLKDGDFVNATKHFYGARQFILNSGLPLRGKLKKIYLEIDKAIIDFEPDLLGLSPKQNSNKSVPLVLSWLNDNLNDPYSMKILSWTTVRKVRGYEGEPFWYVSVKLRAKNAYNAYVLNVYNFYIQKNKIVRYEN